jgi:hypothetical protein
MKKIIFLFFLVLSPMLASAYDYDVQIDGIYYYLYSSNKTAEVKGGGWGFPYAASYSGEITIPSEVTYNGVTYNVSIIGPYAFQNCTNLNSVTIPNSVTVIDSEAFEECSSLTSVTIPNSVTTIGDFAFSGCAGFTSLTIPNSVTTIGWYAFGGCVNLASVTIGNSVVSISSHAFSYCPNLTDVICLAETIPTADSDIFQESNIEKVTLHVPAASISAYQATEPWKNFKEIVALSTQEKSNYLPFVDRGKRWIVTRFTPGQDGIDEVEYYIPQDMEEVDGKSYYKMKTTTSNNTETETYLIREESQKVYYYDPDLKMEFLAFDYSLKEGDTYETYSYETHDMVTYTVGAVEDYTDGPQVKEYYYDEKTGSIAERYRYLRKWVVSSYIESALCLEPKVWVEGIGSLERPLRNLYHGSYTLDCLAYVLYNGQYDLYLPIPFNASSNTVLWYGRNMPTGAKNDNSQDEHHQLTYELEGDRLHVYGEVFCNCGPNHYAYFIEEPSGDHLVRKLHFKIQDVEPLMWCEAFHTTDFYVEGFPPSFDYIIIDNQGEEHPVINKAPLNVYRPFIQDGKVWIVKVITDGLPTEEWLEYYYLNGDTIVGGQEAKRMLYDRIASSQDTAGEYVGAWYEQDQKVYFADNGKQQFELLYDFTLKSLDTMPNLGGSISVVYKWTGIYSGFKGTLYTFGQERWYEGVGSDSWPYVNHPWYLDSGRKGILLACIVGDEIIYLNDIYVDEITPEGARKNRFDFTHTIKTKPKAPRRSEGQGLYGEYNDLKLGINLNSLDDAYLVRITDESGKVVYEKAVNAGNIVGLNIDISAYEKGRYTVTVENSDESFTGEFEAQATGIEAIINNKVETRNVIYNLQGQRLSSLQKGLNIVNGQKIYVK